MRIKLLFISLLLSGLTLKTFGQTLPEPQGWQKETFALPPQFASSIPVKGTEDIRFSPEWAKKGTDGYWTYCFLWKLEGTPDVTAAKLKSWLHDYYTGLIKLNFKGAKIDTNIAIPVTVSLHTVRPTRADKQVIEGQVNMTDYMTQQPITLYFRIRVKRQVFAGNMSAIFFEASPKMFDNKVWMELDEIDKQIK